MRNRLFRLRVMLLVLVSSLILVLALAAQSQKTLVVAEHLRELAVIEMNGRPYIEVEALTQLENGSFSFNGNQIVLILPKSSANRSATAP